MFPKFRPALAVYSSDFLGRDPARFVEQASTLGVEGAWLLGEGDAVAVLQSKQLIAANGFAEDGGAALRSYVEFNAFERELFASATLPLNGDFPTARFNVTFVFPFREEPHRMIAKSSATKASPLGLRLYRRHDCGKSEEQNLTDLFGRWFEKATAAGFHGEVLQASRPEIRPCFIPEKYPFPQQFGIEVHFDQINEISLSWLELFFLLRRELPKTKRVSLQFWDPVQ